MSEALIKSESGMEQLKQVLRGYGSFLIAYSGGVNSTFLCYENQGCR